jgi:hypothetical protein
VNKGVGIAMVPLTNQAARGPLEDAKPLINTPFEEVAAQLSPDGRVPRLSIERVEQV